MDPQVKRLAISVFFGLFVVTASLNARLVQKTIKVSVIEEVINNKTFTHRVDIINGKRDERWALDGRVVDRQEFQEEFLDAQKEELRQEYLKQEETQKKHDEFTMQFQRDSFAKIIEISLSKINDELARVSDKRLEPFLAFEKNTIASAQELDTLQNSTLVRAHEVLKQKYDIPLDELRTMMTTLEPFADRIRDFYYATVKNAQDRSDDTKLLKDLLAMISE